MEIFEALYVLCNLITVAIVAFACGRVYPPRLSSAAGGSQNDNAAWGVRRAAAILIIVWGLSYTFFLPLFILQLPPETEAIVNTFLTFAIILTASVTSVWSVNKFLQLRSCPIEWLPFVVIPELGTFILHLIVSTPLTLFVYFGSVLFVYLYGIGYFYRRYKIYARLIREEYSNLTDRDLHWVSGLCVAMAIQSVNFVGVCILNASWLEFLGLAIVSFSAILLQQCAFRTKPLSPYLIEQAAVEDKYMAESERTPDTTSTETLETLVENHTSAAAAAKSESDAPAADAGATAPTPQDTGSTSADHEDTRQKVYAIIRYKLADMCEANKTFLDPDLTRETLCSIINVNRTYLSDYLRSEGTTYYNYINTLRIHYAVKLLEENPSLPLVDISYRSGYSNPATFRRAFRDIMGCLPSEYVARNIQQD